MSYTDFIPNADPEFTIWKGNLISPVRLTLPLILSQPIGVASATSYYLLVAFAISTVFMLLFMYSISMETNVSALIGRSKNFAHRLRLTNYGDLE